MILIKKIYEKLKNLKYENTAMAVFALSILAGGINYLFQVIAGRIYSPDFFGQISVLFSIIAIFASFGSSLMKTMAVKTASADKESIESILIKCPKNVSLYFSFIFLIISAATYYITRSVFTSAWFFLICFPIIFSYSFEGVLQGIGKVVQAQFCEVIASVFKLIFLLSLLSLGIGQVSIPIGCGAMNLVVLGYAAFTLKRNGIKIGRAKEKVEPFNENRKERIKENKKRRISEKVKECFKCTGRVDEEMKGILKHYASSLISVFSLTAFNYLDVLAVQHFFSDYEVGQYSAASLFGKIILYIPAALVMILIPEVAKVKERSLKVLLKTLIYSVILSLIASIGLFILKKPLVLFLMGEKYLPCLYLFVPTCVMMISLVVYTVLVNYELAISDENFLMFITPAVVILSIISLSLFHSTISACLLGLAGTYFAAAVVIGWRILRKDKRTTKR